MSRKRLSLFAIFLVFILSSCLPQAVTETPLIPISPTSVATDVATTIPTLEPPRKLTVCLGDEPDTLYPFGEPNSAARSVLAAIYDGPVDVVKYGYEPVILTKIPNIADGDAQVGQVTVSAGSEVLDVTGNLVNLKVGVRIRPSGCRADTCAVAYDGSSSLQMDQMTVTFNLVPELTWSDGAPLTAQDSIFAYDLANDDDTPVSKFLIDRTLSYTAVDDETLQWQGKPGYVDPDYYTNFWMPLPQHVWEQFSAADLLKNEASTRLPLGWGPYIVDEWVTGEYIHLRKNIAYFRYDSGLPKFDELIFRFISDPNAAITALLNDECDLLDPSTRLDGQVSLLLQMQKDGQAKMFSASTNTIEWLSFGIVPATFDDGFNASAGFDRADFFGDKRMRQAIALCSDRQKIVDTVLYGLSFIPDAYLANDDPLHTDNLQTYPFDPEAGNKLLDQIGWLDHDNNPSTPRRAFGVGRVPNGTPLVLTYKSSAATQRRQVADILAQSMSQCSIGIYPAFYSAVDFYSQGPVGPLFGRQFDLAEYAMASGGLEPPCSWFTSAQVPNAANQWAGTNVSGYDNPEFDLACHQAASALPGDPQYTLHQQAQAIFASELPSLPLYFRLRVAAGRPDFCHFAIDPSSSVPLQDIELFDYGESCP